MPIGEIAVLGVIVFAGSELASLPARYHAEWMDAVQRESDRSTAETLRELQRLGL